ncbi:MULTISPECIES: hypothetical protein [Bacillus]|uniref:hypothetical protein n=1 Tax=Bacillus TaxID=1386 RepID=UPI00146CB4EB|nr:hypothetical protein [Bacillus paranthracis]MDF9513447.1 hypothetical protein [Bacillus paranthracis]MDF9672421.1 hypothetical protein [Bacillus paranthracis]MDG1612127.1 hypothetical protein [Bacillus paranthracis]NMW17176.1 hypothetical protein [Bacillus paranthracis]
MERYKEISLADVFELILKGEISDIYYQNGNKELSKATDTHWYLKTIAKYKFFKREVIE